MFFDPNLKEANLFAAIAGGLAACTFTVGLMYLFRHLRRRNFSKLLLISFAIFGVLLDLALSRFVEYFVFGKILEDYLLANIKTWSDGQVLSLWAHPNLITDLAPLGSVFLTIVVWTLLSLRVRILANRS